MKQYTNEYLINLLQSEFELTNEIPKSTTKRNVSDKTFMFRFGSWNKALTAASLPTRPPQNSTRFERNCAHCLLAFTTNSRINASCCSTVCANKLRRIHPERVVPTRTEYFEQAKAAYKLVPFDDVGWDTKRKRVIEEQNDQCSRCGVDEWQGVKLSLDVDHINGDRFDHRRENLEALCPNCHSITPTFKGKNKNTKRKQVSDEQLLEAIRITSSIRQALIKVGISPRGANYNRAHELIIKLNNSSIL